MALANLREFADLLCCPGQPDRRITLRWDQEKVVGAVASGSGGLAFSAIAGQPVLVDFARSVLRSPEVVRFPPVRRSAGWLRATKKRITGLFDTTLQSRAAMARLGKLLTKSGARPVLLLVGGGARGAGTEPLYDDPTIQVLAFDIYPSPNTQFIADAHQMPLIDSCVDGICIQAVLEHVLDPRQVVEEAFRVLKPDGFIYAETPFMQQVHEGAYDFTRFTEVGHRWIFRKFEALDRGVHGGPGASLYWSVRHFFMALTRSRLLGEMLALPFLMVRLADYITDPRHSVDAANGVYFFGQKKQRFSLIEKDVSSEYRGAQR